METVDLPNGSAWKSVKVIPDPAGNHMRLLVAPQSRSNGDGMDDISDMMIESVFGMTMSDPPDSQHLERVQVWEYNHLDGNKWTEIRTRGSIPDLYSIIRMGSKCCILQDRLVLFGGTKMVNIGGTSYDPRSSAGGFILDFRTREWFRVPHPYAQRLRDPYAQSMFRDSEGRPTQDRRLMNVSLPPFQVCSTVEIEDEEMIMILRHGEPVLNPKRGNELVPKYGIDVFSTAIIPDSTRPGCFFSLDMPANDRCGYIAQVQAESLLTGTHLLIMNLPMGSGMVQHLPDGGRKHDFVGSGGSIETNFCALDLKSMEWRGVEVHKANLLISCEPQIVIPSQNSNVCHIVAKTGSGLEIFALSGLDSLSKSFTKPLSNRKRLSK